MESQSRRPSMAVAPSWESLESVLGLAADWIWEQDTEFRFTRMSGEVREGLAASNHIIGQCAWDLPLYPCQESGNWESHRDLLAKRLPFRGWVVRCELSNGEQAFFSISGAPSYDAEGRWTGYRGVGEDVTQSNEANLTLEQYKAIVDTSPDCVFLTEVDSHTFLYANETAAELTGFQRDELLTMRGYEMTGRTLEHAQKMFADAIEARVTGVTEPAHFAMSKDGGRKGWWEPHHRAVKLDGRWCVITVSREVTGRVFAEQGALRAKRMYAALSATNEAIMRARDFAELYQGVCDAAVRAGGLPSASVLLAQEGSDLLRPAAAAGAGKSKIFEARFSTSADRPEGQGVNGVAFCTGEPCISHDFLKDPRTKAWHAYAEHMQLKSCASIPIIRAERPIGVLFLCASERRAFDDETVSLLKNMTENLVFGIQTLEHEVDRERAEARVRYLATHDSLTALPNRVLFAELLDQAITTARRGQQGLAVMFIDLDRFKLVNDSLGHAAGDILLKEMSGRLRSVLRDSDVVARLGGDEFVILLQGLKRPEDAAVVARKLLDASLAPIHILGQECRVTASIGISLYPEHGVEHNELMKNADTAMYLAKERGKNTFEFYSPGMQSQSTERLALEAGLRNAIANNEFHLEYQAKLDLKTNKISGVEALLRWHHPIMGNIPPQRFIPLCEENGTIVSIGRWVLEVACRQNVEWQKQGLPPITMAVNLSARQFSDPNLLEDVRTALRESGMPPTLLELELTESMVMLNPLKTIEILSELKSIGVRIALDDFGVGYSSLAQIKGFPIDTLKVDRSFIRNLPESTKDRAITQAIISMARSLSLSVIAEGVETEAQESFLRDHSCDESQGYYFSKPASSEAFAALLKNQMNE